MSLRKRNGSPFWQYDFAVKGVRFRGSTGEETKQRAKEVEAQLRGEAAARRSYSESWRLRELSGSYWSEHGIDTAAADNIFRSLAHLSRLIGPDTEITDILRHTFASWARQNGADIAAICEALGHSDISVTMKYAHIKPDQDITAFDRVAAAFTSQPTAQKTG